MSSFTHKATAVKLGSSGWPVDERSGRAKTHKIHADGLDEDEFTLIFTDPRHNANKFHTVQLLQPLLPDGEWRLYQRQGRVGQVGTKKEMRSGSEMILKWEFCEIYKSKTGRHWMDRDFCSAKTGEYAHIPHDPQIQELRGDDGAVHEVVRLVYPDRTLRSHPTWYKMQYDSARLPLGPVSGQAMEAAQAVLAALDKLLSTCIPVTNAASLTELSKSYYTYIPHAFTVAHGVPVINTRRLLDKEQRYLKEVQKEMKALQWIQEEPSHTKSMITLNELCVDEFASVKKCTSEYTALKEYCTSFRGSTHGHITYAIVDIFRVERTEERRRFGATSGTGHDNRRLLWHGSPLTNFAGILKEGLQVKTPADKGQCVALWRNGQSATSPYPTPPTQETCSAAASTLQMCAVNQSNTVAKASASASPAQLSELVCCYSAKFN